jgi:hypothetical protein
MDLGSDAMTAMNFSELLAIAAGLGVLICLGIVWWRFRRRQSPAEQERARRLEVNNSGRLTDGVLVESPYGQAASQTPELVFYRYFASGVEYTAAQDVSALSDIFPPASCRPGSPTAVKYDPRRPSNSIVICEQWSGMRSKSPEAARANGA